MVISKSCVPATNTKKAIKCVPSFKVQYFKSSKELCLIAMIIVTRSEYSSAYELSTCSR